MFSSGKTFPSILLSSIVSLFAKCRFDNSNSKRLRGILLRGIGELYIGSVDQHLRAVSVLDPSMTSVRQNFVISSEVVCFHLFSRA